LPEAVNFFLSKNRRLCDFPRHDGKITLFSAARRGKMTMFEFCPQGIPVNKNVSGHPGFPAG
jgi:hypothetical protein